MKKNIDVFTNDPANNRITLTITGTVSHFARMEPAYARLVGPAGTEIKEAITITREKAYPFKILDAKSRNGSDIAINFKEFNEDDRNGYILTIENKKAVAGRYADTVILTTDSSVKPTITIPVYGQIISAAPQPAPAPPKKSASGG